MDIEVHRIRKNAKCVCATQLVASENKVFQYCVVINIMFVGTVMTKQGEESYRIIYV